MYIVHIQYLYNATCGGKWRALMFSQFWFLLCYSNVFDEFVSPTTPLEADSVITATRKAFQNENAHAMGHNKLTNFCFLLKSQTKMIFNEIYYIFNRPFYREWMREGSNAKCATTRLIPTFFKSVHSIPK